MFVANCVHEPVRIKTPRLPSPPSPTQLPLPSTAATQTSSPVEEFRAFMRSASSMQRVLVEREGVPARVVESLLERMRATPAEFRQITGMPRSSLPRKLREAGMVASGGGLAVVCLIDMINRVEDMLNADGDEIARGFDVFEWLGRWMRRPQRALAGMTPMELIDTPTGRQLVVRLIGAMQSGVYL